MLLMSVGCHHWRRQELLHLNITVIFSLCKTSAFHNLLCCLVTEFHFWITSCSSKSTLLQLLRLCPRGIWIAFQISPLVLYRLCKYIILPLSCQVSCYLLQTAMAFSGTSFDRIAIQIFFDNNKLHDWLEL